MKKYSEYFTRKKRNDGQEFICLMDERPQELHNLIYEIHINHFDKSLPCDWIYENIYESFEALEGDDDFDDVLSSIEADIYNVDLCEWLKNSYAQEYCNEAMQEYHYVNIMDCIQGANYRAKEAIYFCVRDFLEDQKEGE